MIIVANPCCCEVPKCGTILPDTSCGPYEGFTLLAFPCVGGAPVEFYGIPDEWAMVACACSTPWLEGEFTINETCYNTTPLFYLTHFPYRDTVTDDCVHLDTTGKIHITSFICI